MFRSTAVFTLIAAALPAVFPADAQTFPSKPVRIVTGAVGNFGDTVTRHIGQRLHERWRQPVVVENKPGAGMTIASGMVARAMPDGYTLLMADRTSFAVGPNLHKSLPYDPVKDFSPITLVGSVPSLLIAHASIPAADLRGFIEYAKEQPGGMIFAAAGPGSVNHLAGALFKQITGVKLVTVHFKGGGASAMAIVGGHVKAGFSNPTTALPHVTAGKVKAYFIASSKRFAGLPTIPTAFEAGLPGFESGQWIGLVAPVRTPASVVAKLNRDFVEILETPAIRDMLLAQGAEPTPGTPDEFAAFIKSETVKLKKVLELAGIKPE